MPTPSLSNARPIISSSFLQDIAASRLCLRCRLKGLAKSQPTVSSNYLLSNPKNFKVGQGRYKSTLSGSGVGSSTQNKSSEEGKEDPEPPINPESQLTTTHHDRERISIPWTGKRSNLPEQLSVLIEGLVAKATIAGQRVNTLTGTDYSGIETLRQKIKEQG